ncbi:DUF1273 domain-containing protein [Enterococcus sp.]|uniref:DUF1273 domain-containing protein n=1 Tax=Enterococcus sp. TaxID=35783 RepID=UPI002897ED03|nr:DUF1273 domain-containing protein [Enterococcus sp.]
MKTLYFTGYRSYELGVFQAKDPKVKVIKKVIKEALVRYIEEGLAWILISGNLGVELWCGELMAGLKAEYPEIKLGIIFPFEGFGENWNETNREALQTVKAFTDYVDATSHKPYQDPSQLRNHTAFLLQHTDGALLLYDEEFPGKTSYFLKDAQDFSGQHPYVIDQITMDDLQNATFDGNLL